MPEDKNWKQNPKAVITRVFNPCGLRHREDGSLIPPEIYGVLNTKDRIEDGTTFPAVSIMLAVNNQLRYVLPETAHLYGKQLQACRRLEKLGLIKEDDPENEHVPFIPKKPLTTEQKRIVELEAKVKSLEHTVAAEEQVIKDSGHRGSVADVVSATARNSVKGK